jgi:A/G-specific adenine glycosylase
LVAEVLLQRSRARTVARVYGDLFARWRTADALSRASPTELEDVIRPLGLVRRAITLQALAREIAQAGEVPRSIADLMKLPGVGEYAAKASAVAAFWSFEPVVDSVTARVYRRFFGLGAGSDPSEDRALWVLVKEVASRKYARELNWAALDLAAAVCLPKIPRCSVCPLRTDCKWAEDLGHWGDFAAGSHQSVSPSIPSTFQVKT